MKDYDKNNTYLIVVIDQWTEEEKYEEWITLLKNNDILEVRILIGLVIIAEEFNKCLFLETELIHVFCSAKSIFLRLTFISLIGFKLKNVL